jgi:photosystem II stability/assembly factor-like uncharacterized protein
MRRVLIVLFIVMISFLAADWQVLGPPGGNFRTVSPAPSNTNIYYLAQATGPSPMWKTTDAGASWFQAGTVPQTVYSMAVDPTNANIIYTGCIPYVYRSSNGGVSWSGTYLPVNTCVYGVAVHPTVPTTIFATSSLCKDSIWCMALLKSTNSGTSWSSETLGVDSSFYSWSYCLAVSPANPNNVYVGGYYRKLGTGTYAPAIYRSTDGGNNFTFCSGTIPGSAYYVYSLTAHETNPNYVYAGTTYGVYRSTDAGITWALASPSNYVYNYALATTPANPNLIYSSGSAMIYRSTDAGVTWSQSGTGLRGTYFYGMAPSRTQANVILIANNADCFKSTDTGTNWAMANNGLIATAITSFINAPSAPATIYTEIEGVAVYKSTNNGSNWTLLPTPLACGVICELAVDPTNPNVILGLEGSG